MKIFKVKANSNQVQSVIPRNMPGGKFLEFMTFDCISKKNVFDEIEWYIFNPKHEKGDFYTGITGALIFDKKVYDSNVFTMFELAGEILPLRLENGELLYALNVIECVNSLNHNDTVWDIYSDGTKGRILKYSFYENSLSESSLFKIPETSQTEIFTYADVIDPDDEFYYEYQKSGLKGLIFEQVFDSEI